MLLRWLKNVLKKSNKTFLLPVKKETSSHGLILKQKKCDIAHICITSTKNVLTDKTGELSSNNKVGLSSMLRSV